MLIVPQPEYTRTGAAARRSHRLTSLPLLHPTHCSSLSLSLSSRSSGSSAQHAAHNAPVDIGAVPAQLHGTPQAAQLLVTWDPDEG